jgi:phenylalanyl-tRNA synthetase beta chain
MGMDAKSAGKDILVRIPATRLDIMHPVDLYGDVAVGYGFENLGGKDIPVQTTGGRGHMTMISECLRDVMTGLGYTEVTTLTLSSENDEFVTSGLPVKDVVRIKNPLTEDHTCLRSSLLPSVMKIVRKNRHRGLPQKFFEIGDVISDTKRQRNLCAVATHAKTSFTEIKSITESILREMRLEYEFRSCSYPTFIEGRGAEVVINGTVTGCFGEMAPEIISNFDVTHPLIFTELYISSVLKDTEMKMF